ncbi:hypothetical protein FBZ93_111148 [Bradyrhizobium macuxiense]|uniref:Uncharacterized protein n=1 Tax=Bradyrhizobium macuxiense TaxID=1755647 RepID=A0A560LD29_9BRAD|nr:hypothetical protein [Bradyrhizobium macuxiense]TWB93109.1 hypothetical protein FBZ93_111148 [Bradyrhizobium macuxiense]
MVIEYSSQTGLRLVNPLDFCNFKVVLMDPVNPSTSALRGITLVDQDNALVPIDLVPTLPGRLKDYETWETAYAKMVASARERGWIDSDANAIRAHIESSL